MINIFKTNNDSMSCCDYILETSHYKLFVENFIDKRLCDLILVKAYSKTIYDFSYHLKCSKCQKEFLYIPSREYIGLINNSDLDIVTKWYTTDNELKILSDSDFSKLKQIGSHVSDVSKLFKSRENWIETPCKVKLKTGEIIDFCTMYIFETVPKIGHFPLYANENSRIIFLSEIERVYESEYALNIEIRSKTHFYPEESVRDIGLFYIKHKNGTIYKVNDISNFLDINDFKGSDFININKADVQDTDNVISLTNKNYKRNYIIASWTFGDNRTLKLLNIKNGSSQHAV